MRQIFGDFYELNDGQEYLVIHFSPTSIPLQQRWRNNGLSADFLAEYWATFFPKQDTSSELCRGEIKGAINYIANELLENVMKFNYALAEQPVSLGLYLFTDVFRFYSKNVIDPVSVPGFQARIQQLLTEDPAELYLEQIEKNASLGDGGSHLGLLTMISDYEAKLAWQFDSPTADEQLIFVTTMVQLSLENE